MISKKLLTEQNILPEIKFWSKKGFKVLSQRYFQEIIILNVFNKKLQLKKVDFSSEVHLRTDYQNVNNQGTQSLHLRLLETQKYLNL